MGKGVEGLKEKMDNYKIKKDKKIAFAAFFYFLASAINSTIKIVVPSVSTHSGLISAITGAFILIYFAMAFPIVWQRSKLILIRSYAVFGFLYLFSIVLSILRGDPIDLIISGSAFLTFAWWIPVGVYACSVSDSKILYDVFYKGSYFLAFVLLLMFVFHPLNIYGETGYNMYFGTTIIIPALFHLNEILKKRKLFVTLFFLLELVAILVYANRGVLASILFFVFYFYCIRSYNSSKKIVAIFFLGACAVFFLVFKEQIFTFFLNILEGLGIQSRTLSMLLDSSFLADSSNRDEIWNQSMRMIEQRPILGWGLGGEYYELARAAGDVDVIDNSFNSHNAIIQNIVDFGVIGGIVASLIFIVPYFGMRRIENIYLHDFVVICGAAVLPCFISAAGLFVKPIAAIFFYLYYITRRRKR